MADEDEQKTNGKKSEALASRNTSMKYVGSTLAVMFIEDALKKGGEINFPSLGIRITKDDLLGPGSENNDKHGSNGH